MSPMRYYRWQVQALPTGHTMNQTWGSHLYRHLLRTVAKAEVKKPTREKLLLGSRQDRHRGWLVNGTMTSW